METDTLVVGKQSRECQGRRGQRPAQTPRLCLYYPARQPQYAPPTSGVAPKSLKLMSLLPQALSPFIQALCKFLHHPKGLAPTPTHTYAIPETGAAMCEFEGTFVSYKVFACQNISWDSDYSQAVKENELVVSKEGKRK